MLRDSRATVVLLAILALMAMPAKAAIPDLAPWLTERQIIGPNDLEPVEKTVGTTIYEWTQAIVRVEVDDGIGYCTGARVGEDLFLTNYHCDLGCDVTVFRMGYQSDIPASERTGFRCNQLLLKNELLDYALYQASQLPGPERVYPILPLSRVPAIQDMRTILASHPTGRLKEVDRSQDCKISDATIVQANAGRETMKHTCDTEGGSSGAPVIDYERGAAIGLHWGGKGNEYNYAIPMPRIIDDLEKKLAPEIFARLHVTDR